jgi:hypothetical protein
LLPEYHTLFTKLALFLTYFRRSLCWVTTHNRMLQYKTIT